MRPQEAIRPRDPERAACRQVWVLAVVRVALAEAVVSAAGAALAAAAVEEALAAGGEAAEDLATVTAIQLSSATGGRTTTV